jgi:hypothetical protein
MKCRCGYPLKEDEEAGGLCETCFMRRMMEIIKEKAGKGEKGAKNVRFLDIDLRETDDPERVFVIQGIRLKNFRRQPNQ